MIRHPRLSLSSAAWRGLLAVVLTVPGWSSGLAQGSADQARIDDFAVPALPADSGPQMEQIGRPASDGAIEPGPPRARDRTLLSSPPGPKRGTAATDQIPGRSGPLGPAQLAPSGRSAAAPAPLSGRADSRPTPAVALTGDDRCDPQAARQRENADRCRRILELRSAEFSARQAPQLSAEQSLLASQEPQDRNRGLHPATSQVISPARPNPDDRSSQELAALIGSAAPVTSSRAEPEEPSPAAGEDLQGALLPILQLLLP